MSKFIAFLLVTSFLIGADLQWYRLLMIDSAAREIQQTIREYADGEISYFEMNEKLYLLSDIIQYNQE